MPVTSYFPPDHDRAPPVAKDPSSPSSPSTSSSRRTSSYTGPTSIPSAPTLPRSTSSQLSIPHYVSGSVPLSPVARRRSSAVSDLDQDAIKQLSARAKEAERRAQWEGSKLLNLEPPTTPPRPRLGQRTTSSSSSITTESMLGSSLYETPRSMRTAAVDHPVRQSSLDYPSSPVRASPRSPRSRDPSYASSVNTNASNLDAISEFLADEPPRTPRSPHSTTSSRRSVRSSRSARMSTIFPSKASGSPIVSPTRSTFDSSSSESDLDKDDDEELASISAIFAPRLVKTSEVDQVVRELNREKEGVIERRRRMEEERKRRERGRTESTSDSSNGASEQDRSRTESATSDASFASMTAVGPPPLPPQPPVIQEEDDLVARMRAPGMERDDTLKASSYGSSGPGSSIGSGTRDTGQVKSIDDIVRGYKALGVGNEVKGILERRRSSVAGLSIQQPRKDPSLDEYQYPTPLSPPATLDQQRPLSPASFATGTSASSQDQHLLPYVPFPLPPTPTWERVKIKSIDEIIAEHAGSSYLNRIKPSPSTTPVTASFPAGSRSRQLSHISSASERDSVSSADRLPRSREISNRRESSVFSSGSIPLSPSLISAREPSNANLDSSLSKTADTLSVTSSSRSIVQQSPSPRSSSPNPSIEPVAPASPITGSQELTALLKSPRLTRLVTLNRAPNSGLTVSLSDVGSPTGHPVLIFLGLGSVRYILALYDELAEIFNLRLICIDRWGLGKTTAVPDSQRGVREWATVVDELVQDHLELERYSILAHSAGAPYAIASALSEASRPRVYGTVHLLAPWVMGSQGGLNADSLAGMYKYLKYVPSGVLKTAQAAEWKIQGWRLGKGPVEDGEKSSSASAPGSSEETTPAREVRRDSFASLGIVGGDLDKLEKMYPDGGIRLAGPSNVSTPVKRSSALTTPKRKPSLSVNGKSFLGGIFGSGKTDTSLPSDDNVPSSRTPNSIGRRTSSFLVNARSTSTPPPPLISSPTVRASGSTLPSTPTSASIKGLSERSPSPALSLQPLHVVRPSSVSSSLLSPASPTSFSTPPPTTRSSISPDLLISGLLRASHAESLSGSTSDLLVLLDRNAQSLQPALAYKDMSNPVRVWYGDRDDRISESSVRWLETEIDRCTVQVVKGADHNMMTNHQVMFEVLESISNEVASCRT
ncbi:alpha/beta fold hydrolase [Sporobolomyces koalae]|uniref:alpha/beta fold hydrolase n=1 Tax=Sporobolomyces koalae TaxID=500713 RepID=UPI003181ACE9